LKKPSRFAVTSSPCQPLPAPWVRAKASSRQTPTGMSEADDKRRRSPTPNRAIGDRRPSANTPEARNHRPGFNRYVVANEVLA
jgi:hypothetical protein